MPGHNQHFIPRHVLKGFAIPGHPKFAWEYLAGSAPEQKRLKKLAAANQFYSEPRADGGNTLDDDITDYEDSLARRLSALRSDPPGPLADTRLAAEIVTHLSIRNDNVRGSIAYGLKLIVRKAFGLVSQEDGMRSLLGLDRTEPSTRFKDQVMRQILGHRGVEQTGLPEAVVTRVAFGLAREFLPTAFERQGPVLRAMLAHLHEAAGSLVRTSHNKALAKGMAPDARAAALTRLSWSVIETPFNIILPDCVAVGITKDGEAQALSLTGTDELATAVMALSSNRLLLGQAPGATAFEPLLFNLHAIACSERFFVSAVTNAELAEWSRFIGVRSRTVIDRGLAEAFAEFAPPIVPRPEVGISLADANPVPVVEPSPLPSCGIHFLGCTDQPTAQKIADAVYGVMAGLAETIPLARLDGITFAADYPAALAALDRGFVVSAPLTTTDEQEVVGVAMAPVVLRDGVVKVHIVLRGYLGDALISDDEATQKSALHVIVGQFAEVGCVELFDSAVPGVMLKPLEDSIEMLCYRHVANAWSGYFAARASAVFAPEFGEVHRTLLIAALQRATAEIPRLRLEYRFHGDVPRLMDAVLKYVDYVLSHAAHLIGHNDGLEESTVDADEILAAELNKLGLGAWFELYRRDLRSLWDRRGIWASLEEFVALSHHVERLLWQFGLFLWQTPEGDCRLEAPLHVDRLALEPRCADAPAVPS